MAMTSLNISLPEALKKYVEGQVASGDWGTPSEYVRELIRQDKERRLFNLEQDLITAARGPNSQEGPGCRIARADPAPVKGQRIVLSDAAVSDIMEQADWYEVKLIIGWRNAGK